jgi:hypothetical protein
MAHRWACMGFIRRLKVILSASLGAAVVLSGSAIAEPDSQRASQLTSQLASQTEAQQLLDLERFPLFLPAAQGTLMADSNQPSAIRIGQPSLTWLQDQLNDRYRRDFYRRDRSNADLYRRNDFLVEQWQAYRVNSLNGSLRYVDMVINELVWNELLDLERYAIILQFGTEAQRYGYQLRVFHSGDAANTGDATTSVNAGLVVWRGAYLCDFEPTELTELTELTFPDPPSSDEICKVVLNNAIRRTRPNR